MIIDITPPSFFSISHSFLDGWHILDTTLAHGYMNIKGGCSMTDYCFVAAGNVQLCIYEYRGGGMYMDVY